MKRPSSKPEEVGMMPHEDRWWEREEKERERGKELIQREKRLREERGEAYRKGKGKHWDKTHGIKPAK